MEGGSWGFDIKLIVLNDMGKEENPREVTLTHTMFWVQTFDLPLGYRIKAMAERLGGVLEKFM